MGGGQVPPFLMEQDGRADGYLAMLRKKGYLIENPP